MYMHFPFKISGLVVEHKDAQTQKIIKLQCVEQNWAYTTERQLSALLMRFDVVMRHSFICGNISYIHLP